MAANQQVKQASETHLQWVSRVARQAQIERDRNEPLVPVEATQHGEYQAVTILDEDGAFVRTQRNYQTSPLANMHQRGQLTMSQFDSAMQIGWVVERLSRAVSVRSASLEARVDCSGSSYDPLYEKLGHVRLEKTYSAWRDRLPMPRRMLVSMVTSSQPLVRTARAYGVPWQQARKRLISALDLWEKVRDETWRAVGQREVEAVYHRLHDGGLADD